MLKEFKDLAGYVEAKNPSYDEMSVSHDGYRFTGLLGKRVVLQSCDSRGEPVNTEVLNFLNTRVARNIYFIQAEVSA